MHECLTIYKHIGKIGGECVGMDYRGRCGICAYSEATRACSSKEAVGDPRVKGKVDRGVRGVVR
jgi:hypothetical protein